MKSRTVTLYRKDLLFDIDAVTHMFGMGQEAAAGDVVSSDTLDDTDKRTIGRFLDHAAVELRVAVGRFVSNAELESASNLLSASDYRYKFDVMDSFRDVNLTAIAAAMHGYMVDSALCEWYTMVGSVEAQGYARDKASKIEGLQRLFVQRDIPKVSR